MNKEEIKKILENHEKYLNDDGGERANLRGADLSGANLSSADLNSADLRDADLSSVDLSNVMLWNTIGNMREIKSLQLEKYPITYINNRLQIGCKNYSIEEWKNFTDDEIDYMDNRALEWWKKWKDYIFTTIEMSPATETGNEEK